MADYDYFDLIQEPRCKSCTSRLIEIGLKKFCPVCQFTEDEYA